jgi:hypothetical protein
MFDKTSSRGEIGCQFPDWYGIGNSVRVHLRLVVYVRGQKGSGFFAYLQNRRCLTAENGKMRH